MHSEKSGQSRVIRVAFLGGGNNSAVGRAHFAAVHLDGLFKITAGCFSRDKIQNLKTAEAYGVEPEHCCDSLEDLLRLHRKVFDVIIILTPTNLHYEHIICCMEKGVPTICEKSMVASLEEAESVLKSQREQNTYLRVTYNYTGYPMVRELQSMIERGELGEIQQIMLEMPQESFIRLNPKGEPLVPQPWRLNDNKIPTLSLDLGTHLQMFVNFLTDSDALEVSATTGSYGNFKEIDDSISCIAKYRGGITCHFWYTKAALGYRNGLRLRVFGSRGSAEWLQSNPEHLQFCNIYGELSSLDRGSPRVVESNKVRYTRFKAGHPAGYIEAFANYYRDLAEELQCLLENRLSVSPYVFGIEAEIKNMAVMEAIWQSSKSGQWVTIGE